MNVREYLADLRSKIEA